MVMRSLMHTEVQLNADAVKLNKTKLNYILSDYESLN